MGVSNSVPAPLPDEKATEVFLRSAFDGKPSNAHILVFTMPGKQSRSFTDIDEAIAYIDQCVATKEVYFGTGFGSKPVERGHRYTKQQVYGIVGFNIDLDVKWEGAHKKHGLPETKDEALDYINSLPLVPTFVVDSGHGYQCHWLLTEPWAFEHTQERLRAEQMQEWWQRFVRMNALKEHAWSGVDPTFDVTRVLRIPGTINHKIVDDELPVVIVQHNPDARYTLEDFERVLEENKEIAQISESEAEEELGDGRLSGNLIVRRDAAPPVEKFGALIAESRQAKNAFYHTRDDGELPSASEHDFALAIAALQHTTIDGNGDIVPLWSDQEITDLLIMHRRKMNLDPKLRADYYARTINKARAEINKKSHIEVVNSQIVDLSQRLMAAERDTAPDFDSRQVTEADTGANDDTDEVAVAADEDDMLSDADVLDFEDSEVAAFVGDDTGISDEGDFVPTAAEIARMREDAQRRREQRAATEAEVDSADPSKVTSLSKKRVEKATKAKKAATAEGDSFALPDASSGMTPEQMRQAILDHLSNVYQPIRFVKILKILGDPPQFRFEFDVAGTKCNLTVKDIGRVITIRSFRADVAGATGILMPQKKQDEWDKHVQAILSAAEPEYIGEEATDKGLVNSWLRAYLETATILYDWKHEPLKENDQYIVKSDGALYFFGADMTHFLRVQLGERQTSPQTIGALFRNRGMQQRNLQIVNGDYRTTRSAWKIPDDIAAPWIDPPKKKYFD